MTAGSIQRRTYTVAEAAELLGISDWALRQAIHRGDAPVPVIQVGRRYVIGRGALDRLVAGDAAAPTQAADDFHGRAS